MKRRRPMQRGFCFKRWAFPIILAMVLNSCAPSGTHGSSPTLTNTAINADSAGTPTTVPVALSPTPQPTAAAASFGPGPADFPAGINPLTGQPVSNPDLLKVPALLISISHFPATARPQAGLSFAPYVFEFSITDGESRFLAAFYGQYPAPEIPVKGNCDVRQGVFKQTDILLGNRVWLDTNKDGIQDQDEPGVPGICVDLYDAQGTLLQKTTTDSNGIYGFNVKGGGSYSIGYVRPDFLDFTKPNVGDESHDSDANPGIGRTAVIHVSREDLLQDAGLVLNGRYAAPTPDPKTDPKPEVGPVRSGRLLYAHIGNFYQDSCLIYAFASKEELPLIPHCAFVTHETAGGGSMLGLDRMKAIAEDNQRKTGSRPFNYTGNLFSDQLPQGGKPGTQLNMFFASLNQSAWFYDPLYHAYLRYVDMADKRAPGVLHADVDRLTGRQIHFENVIVAMADTDVISPTNLDIRLDAGNRGNAYLFRDARVFPIKWSTRAGTYEKQTGLRRPIQFINSDGSPVPLKPGHTWIILVTPFTPIEEQQPGVYLVRYAAPEGESR